MRSPLESELLRGEVENLAIDSFGRLTLGPTSSTLYDASAPFLWTVVNAPDGSLYAGSGNANFFYAITLVWGLGQSLLVCDLMFAVLRDEWEVERPEMAGKEIRDISGFSGKRIGVGRATTTEKVLRRMLKDTLTDAEVVLVNSSAEGVEALKSGAIDAFSADQVVLMGLAMTSGEKYAIASEVFSYEPFALAVRRNDADFRLVADSVLSHLYRTGLILEVYDRWFGRFSKKRSRIIETLYQLNATPE